MSDDTLNVTTADLAATDDVDRPLTRDSADESQPDEVRRDEALEPLLGNEDAERYQSRWQDLQASFVDEPQRVVEQADELVAELMQLLAQTFAEERRGLEEQWSRGDDVSTEDLRVALTRYRSFFQRLLAN
jgi:hypothetical protein